MAMTFPSLIRTFEFLKTQDRAGLLLHILTRKKGYPPCARAAGPNSMASANSKRRPEGAPATDTPTYSQLLGTTLAKYAESNSKLLAITAAMPTGTGLVAFQAKRCLTVISTWALPKSTRHFSPAASPPKDSSPSLAIYSTFMQRAFDMIVHDMAIQNLNVALCMDRASLSGDDGPTHHGLFDIGYPAAHPEHRAHATPDEPEFADMLWTILHYEDGPILPPLSAWRRHRRRASSATPKLLEIGKAEVVRHGKQVAIFAARKSCSRWVKN